MKNYRVWMTLGLAMLFFGSCISMSSAAEYRAVWIDAWGAGFRSQAEVDTLLGKVGDPNSRGTIRNANLNAVFIQVRRRADVCYPSGMGEPYFSGLSPSNFNALQAVINAAHDTTGGKERIEVHAWIVAFATSSSGSTPPPNSIYWQHNDPNDPENYWMTLDNNGNETGDKAFDPGHPKALEYLTDVCLDLITNYDIDGLHYDYIRFTGSTQGYNPVSVARYNERYGLTGQPSSNNEQFKQWRRDQVTSLVRRVYAKAQAVRPSVKISGAFVTWNPSPTSSTRAAFMNTRPYYDVYSDWDAWTEEGIIDISMPMTYYDWASLPNDYIRWMNFQKDRKFNRQVMVGPGTYMNFLNDAILELQMTRDPSPAGNYADGFCAYSYRSPYSTSKSPRVYGSWTNFAPHLVANVTPTKVPIPDMPWKSSPTRGHIMGTVTRFEDNSWADGANVTISGPVNRSMLCDGTGFYAFIDLLPGNYLVTASKAGYPNISAWVNVTAGNMSEQDFVLGGNQPPVITNVQAVNITNNNATITWDTDTPSWSQVLYGTTPALGQSSLIFAIPKVNHSVTLNNLQSNTLYYYRAVSTNEFGPSQSEIQTFWSSGPPTISNIQVSNITSNTATITWETNAPASSLVNYGTTSAYGLQSSLQEEYVTQHSVTLTGLPHATQIHFQAVSGNIYGTDASENQTFTTGSFTGEVIVDNTDNPGFEYIKGEWIIATASSKWGVDYFWEWGINSMNESAATHVARWTPNLPVSGYWDVYIWYARGTNRSDKTFFKVVNAEAPLELRVNQQINGNGWTKIASNVPFYSGSQGYIEIGNNIGDTSKIVQGDAVRLVYISGDIQAPTVPTGLTALAMSPTSVQLDWNPSLDDNGVTGYKIFRPAHIGTSATNSYLDSQDLSPNTAYVYQVSAFDAADNESEKTSPVPVVTLSVPPGPSTVTSDKPAGEWQADPDFTFTAVGGFGPGRVAYYRYVWNTSTGHAFAGTENVWSMGNLIRTAAEPGFYYLHLMGYNSQHVPNGQISLGPYQYGSQAPEITDVFDERYTISTDTLNASWSVDDPEAGLLRYEVSVGSTPGLTDVRDWTDVGVDTSTAIMGLSLSVGETYYINVRTVSVLNEEGDAASSAGVTVAMEVANIGQAKMLPDTTPVFIPNRGVTAIFGNAAYIQEIDRSSGIRVEGAEGLEAGQQYGIYGRLALKDDAERMLQDAMAVPAGASADISPVSVVQSRLGGGDLNQYTPGITGGTGLNNIGLLVRIHGRVTALLGDGFYLDDGSSVPNGSQHSGVKVWTGSAPAVSEWQWVNVIGISSSYRLGDIILPVVLAQEIDAFQ